MKEAPIVSVIIPVFNREELIKEALDSVLAQSMKNWECLIVDDGSIDKTVETVKKYSERDLRFRFYKRTDGRLKGANSCRNIGFENAKGKYIKFLDSDDLLMPNCLQRQVEIMKTDESLMVCFSYGLSYYPTSGKTGELWSHNTECPDYLLGHITNQIRWAIADPLWRKSFFKEPPFKEGLMNSQEWLMHGLALLKLRKEEIYNLKESLVLVRREGGRMSNAKTKTYWENQEWARRFLLKELLLKNPFKLGSIRDLFKQILIYRFWTIRSKFQK